MHCHFVARTAADHPLLLEPLRARWLWARLREHFPNALAATLLPRELHLVIQTGWPRHDRQRLARLLGAFGRRFPLLPKLPPGSPWGPSLVEQMQARWAPRGHSAKGADQAWDGLAGSGQGWAPDGPDQGVLQELAGPLWEAPAPARAVPDRLHLKRHVRYVALLPCREGLAGDPLEWPWSTHRDLCGGILDPWVSSRRLARALDDWRDDFDLRHHAWVAADPTVGVSGSRLPVPAGRSQVPIRSLSTVRLASLACTRQVDPRVLRFSGPPQSVFVALAWSQGWRDPHALARFADMPVRRARCLLHFPRRNLLPAALRCVGDRRLLQFPLAREIVPGPERPVRRRGGGSGGSGSSGGALPQAGSAHRAPVEG